MDDRSPSPPIDSSTRTAKFVPLLSANARRIYGYILTLLPNPADAEEVFQEVNILLWERFDEFEEDTNFGAWACRIAYYKALHILRRRNLQPTSFSDSTLESLDAELLEMDDSLDAEYQALADCLAKLRESDRELITLRYGKEGSPHQLAERLNRPVKVIYRSLDRIRRALLECISRKLASGE
jgi:RNA polymerase sigma-70 factor (ECF subfamily)